MVSIRKATTHDASLLTQLAITTFIESHGHSAKQEDTDAYIRSQYTEQALHDALRDSKNNYFLIFLNDEPAGFSNIIFNCPYEGSEIANLTKLDRIYVLSKFYDKKLGGALFDFAIALMKEQQQAGTWLYTWIKNERAIRFYKRKRFVINGHFDFRLSENHINPNYRMLLLF